MNRNLKVIYVTTLICGIISCQSNHLFNKSKRELVKINKEIETHFDKDDVSKFKPSFKRKNMDSIITSIPEEEYFNFLFRYADVTFDSSFFNLESTLKKIGNDTIEIKRLLNESKKIKHEYVGLDDNTKSKKILKSFPRMKSKIDYWEQTLSNKLTSIRAEIANARWQKEKDSLNNELAFKDTINNQYHSKSFLKKTVDSFMNDITTKLESLNIGNGETFKIEGKRMGENGEDLEITVSPNYEENHKYFDNGEYQSPYVNTLFDVFTESVFNKIFDSTVVSAIFQGEADANPVAKNSEKVKYNAFSNIWGEIRYQLSKETVVELKPNQSISNFQLAFLRAYNVEKIFLEYFPSDTNHKIIVIDHKSGSKDGKNRNATIKVYIFNFFIDYLKNQHGDFPEQYIDYDKNFYQKPVIKIYNKQ